MKRKRIRLLIYLDALSFGATSLLCPHTSCAGVGVRPRILNIVDGLGIQVVLRHRTHRRQRRQRRQCRHRRHSKHRRWLKQVGLRHAQPAETIMQFTLFFALSSCLVHGSRRPLSIAHDKA